MPRKIQRNQSTQDIADLLSLDTSTILGWVKLGLPHTKPAHRKDSFKFSEAEVVAWMRTNGKTGEVGRPADPGSDELAAMKLRKEAALVSKYERENKVEEGKLIDAAAEQARDVQKIITARNRLCSLGATISPQLEGMDGPQRQSIIDAAVEEILQEFGAA